MPNCQICKKVVQIPFVCNYCNEIFCVEHRLPENHACSGLPKEVSWQSRKENRTEAEYPIEKPVFVSEDNYHFIRQTEDNKKPKRKPKKRVRLKNVALAFVAISSIAVLLFVLLQYPISLPNIPLPDFSPDTTEPDVDSQDSTVEEPTPHTSPDITEPDSSSNVTPEVLPDEVENRIFELINEERVSRGFPTLLPDTKLEFIANKWSEDLIDIGNLTHGDFKQRMTEIKYSQYHCGEIIAWRSGWTLDIARNFGNGWIDSTEHYEIMMTNSSGYMGVGVSKSGADFYAVVDFRFD